MLNGSTTGERREGWQRAWEEGEGEERECSFSFRRLHMLLSGGRAIRLPGFLIFTTYLYMQVKFYTFLCLSVPTGKALYPTSALLDDCAVEMRSLSLHRRCNAGAMAVLFASQCPGSREGRTMPSLETQPRRPRGALLAKTAESHAGLCPSGLERHRNSQAGLASGL